MALSTHTDFLRVSPKSFLTLAGSVANRELCQYEHQNTHCQSLPMHAQFLSKGREGSQVSQLVFLGSHILKIFSWRKVTTWGTSIYLPVIYQLFSKGLLREAFWMFFFFCPLRSSTWYCRYVTNSWKDFIIWVSTMCCSLRISMAALRAAPGTAQMIDIPFSSPIQICLWREFNMTHDSLEVGPIIPCPFHLHGGEFGTMLF